MSSTIQDLLKAGKDDATALSAPGGVPLTYRALRAHVADVVRALNAQGIGANDRVAIVLDNGPEMAAAFLGIGSAATAAPLNPSYRAEEFEFYLTDLNAKLLVVAQGKDSPAIAVAEKLGVPIARLVPTPEKGAGSFGLDFSGDNASLRRHAAGRDARRHCARAAHVGHDLASQDRSARPQEHRGVGVEHPRTRSR